MSTSPASSRAQTQAARAARRNARRLWRRDLLERAAAGETRQALADDQSVEKAVALAENASPTATSRPPMCSSSSCRCLRACSESNVVSPFHAINDFLILRRGAKRSLEG